MIRATTKERLDVLEQKVRACFEAAATATGCTVDITPDSHPYTDIKPSQIIAGFYEDNSAELGRPMKRYADLEDKSSGSTDMGNVSHVVPAIHPGIHIDSPHSNHHPGFAATTITPSGEQAIRDGALAMAWTIIDMAENDVWGQL